MGKEELAEELEEEMEVKVYKKEELIVGNGTGEKW